MMCFNTKSPFPGLRFQLLTDYSPNTVLPEADLRLVPSGPDREGLGGVGELVAGVCRGVDGLCLCGVLAVEVVEGVVL